MELSLENQEVLRFCAKIRDLDARTLEKLLGDIKLYRLLDVLAQECDITDVQHYCHDCRHWKYVYSLPGLVQAGVKLKRGICSNLSYTEETLWCSPVATSPADSDIETYRENAIVHTLNTFCCPNFELPRLRAEET